MQETAVRQLVPIVRLVPMAGSEGEASASDSSGSGL